MVCCSESPEVGIQVSVDWLLSDALGKTESIVLLKFNKTWPCWSGRAGGSRGQGKRMNFLKRSIQAKGTLNGQVAGGDTLPEVNMESLRVGSKTNLELGFAFHTGSLITVSVFLTVLSTTSSI